MTVRFGMSSLIPRGLVVERVEPLGEVIVVTARSDSRSAPCPACSATARRVHSRYIRHAADLPSAGRRVRLRLVARRFRCDIAGCRRRIFVERFGSGIVETYARRTARLDCLVHHLGLALGGRPAESFARRLMVPVSKDTLPRAVRRHARPYADPLEVIGIDDWALRRNHRYGTIVCDLARRRVVALLPDREAGTVEAWLKAHSDVRVIARDRGGGYGEASARALPDAVQVADRWQLLENAGAALLDSVLRSMRAHRARRGDHRPRAADGSGAAAVRGLPAAGGHDARDSGVRCGWFVDQGDRQAHGPQPKAGPAGHPRRAHRRPVPDAIELAGALSHGAR
jgi:transposase